MRRRERKIGAFGKAFGDWCIRARGSLGGCHGYSSHGKGLLKNRSRMRINLLYISVGSSAVEYSLPIVTLAIL